MKNKLLLLTFFTSFFIIFTCGAKMPAIDTGLKKTLPPVQKFFVGSAMDGGIFSTATIQQTSGGVTTNTIGTVRFSYVVNLGLTFNYNFSRHIGIYTGIGVKNIGFIEKNADAATVKRRTYDIGAPLGIKIGNMVARKPYLFFGGGVDAPFNYREKTFVIRDQKTKFSEWFSDRTTAVMPYIFAGVAINQGFTIKAQYYLANFFNTDYKDASGDLVYAGTDVRLILLSIGFAVPLGKRHDIVKEQVSELHTM